MAALGELPWTACTAPLTDNRIETALFAYDTFLTLSQEIEFIWHKPLKLGTVLYLMARYSILLDFSLEMLLIFLNTSFKVGYFTSANECS